jgi:hypothetical protein
MKKKSIVPFIILVRVLVAHHFENKNYYFIADDAVIADCSHIHAEIPKSNDAKNTAE